MAALAFMELILSLSELDIEDQPVGFQGLITNMEGIKYGSSSEVNLLVYVHVYTHLVIGCSFLWICRDSFGGLS